MKVSTLPAQISLTARSANQFDEIDYVGNTDLVNKSILAIFSSAQCPASLILRAHDYAKEIRNGENVIISGFHSPPEKEVLNVLLKGTCPLIVVLGRRLENARFPITWRPEIEKGRMLVISPFKEYQTQVNKDMALKRNDLAARIAGRVLIIYASEGGSLNRLVEKWKSEGIDVESLR